MILGVASECLSRVRDACGWLSLGRVSRSGDSLERVSPRKDIMDWCEPRGSPRRTVPVSQERKGRPRSGGGRACGIEGEVKTHLPVLIFRSEGGSRFERSVRDWETSIGGPKMLPSSRYHEWKEFGETACNLVMMG
jgi:hypothetical protein